MSEELYFEKRLNELALRADKLGTTVFTRFLDMAQQQAALRIARENNVQCTLFGGFDEAERRVAAFHTYEPDQEFPIRIIEIAWRSKFGSPSHRDLLGALMALGFERERIGDIVLAEEKAYVFADPEMADYIVQNFESAGRVSVKCRLTDSADELPQPKGRHIRDTVPSLRLDALTAAGFSLSRSAAAEAINAGKVFVNQVNILRTDYVVPENALISLRRTGRMRFEGVDGHTRKDRLAVRLFIYGE